MTKSRHYHVVWVYCEEFPERAVPLVLLADGKPGYLINQWIFYLLDEEITQAQLDQYQRALCHLYDFTLSRFPESSNAYHFEGLIADFIDAKKLGTDSYCITSVPRYSWLHDLGLHWKPLIKRSNTIALYLNAINRFDEWQVSFHGSIPLNPYEERVMTVWEIYHDFKQRKNWDPFLHLHSAKQHVKRDYQTAVYGKFLHKRTQNELHRGKQPKSFPLNKFLDLIGTTPNPRDKMLWLLMGAGSLRSSETLHLFLTDAVGVNPKHGDMQISLADPEDGFVQWHDCENIPHSATRTEYFSRVYQNQSFSIGHPLRNLQPRTKYGRRNSGLHAGFKGMTFGDTDSVAKLFPPNNSLTNPDPHYIWWFDERLGQHFSDVFQEYRETYIWQNKHTGHATPKNWPWHPWMLISTNPSHYGMPFTIPSLRRSWKRALKRIGLEHSGLGPHSLRHMYGYYCANILKLRLEVVQVLMHHASPDSTQVYYSLENSVIREMINNAAKMDEGINSQFNF